MILSPLRGFDYLGLVSRAGVPLHFTACLLSVAPTGLSLLLLHTFFISFAAVLIKQIHYSQCEAVVVLPLQRLHSLVVCLEVGFVGISVEQSRPDGSPRTP